VTISYDGATGWSEPRFQEELWEPICMGSLVRLTKTPEQDRNRLLFVNPHNLDRSKGQATPGQSRDRRNLSIQLSYDEGKTWPVNKSLEAGYGGYSDLAVLPSGEILCFYERGDTEDTDSYRLKYLTVASFTLAWLTDGKDSPATIAD
jgi:sialidase-1